MADSKLEYLRQLMREEEEKKNGGSKPTSSGDNASYRFWDIPENTTAVIRLVPDKDESNPWPWVERQVIRLRFAGTIGGDSPTDNPVTVTVPCVDMFEDKTCPIIAETRPWWKDDSKVEIARQYYKKRSWISSGFVVSSPIVEDSVPENPLRRFIFGKELIDKLKAGLADPEMEHLPTDYINGTDFKIRKTKKGGKDNFNSYATSEWSRRSRALSEAEMIAIEQFGLHNLADFRGPRPDADGMAAIKAMFHASLRGEPYDFSEFGKYPWRPYGSGNASSQSHDEDDDMPKPTAKPAVKPVAEASAQASTNDSQNILAKLRERTAKRS